MMKPESQFIDRAHPDEGDWRAYLDGELPLLRRLTLRRHARRCGACRRQLADMGAAGARTTLLLRMLTPISDVGDSWERLNILARQAMRRPRVSPATAFMAGGLSAAGIALGALLLHPAPTRLLGHVHGVGVFTDVLDQCCAEMEPTAREGIFTVNMPGWGSPLTVRYTDVDRSGDLSSGDVVQSISAADDR